MIGSWLGIQSTGVGLQHKHDTNNYYNIYYVFHLCILFIHGVFGLEVFWPATNNTELSLIKPMLTKPVVGDTFKPVRPVRFWCSIYPLSFFVLCFYIVHSFLFNPSVSWGESWVGTPSSHYHQLCYILFPFRLGCSPAHTQRY